MTKNIKEIGKELLGKSLNSYHRRTGLTQLEKNNEMQDGILDGILSQVDDAYIEKTEQSNVIHLDGSGDGVVVVDGIEGNTMVNLVKMTSSYIATVETLQHANIKLNQPLKANTVYTRFYHVKTLQKGDVIEYPTMYDMVQGTTNKQYSKYLNSLGWHTSKFTNLYDGHGYQIIVDAYWRRNNTNDCKLEIDNFFILEGDWTDKPIPTHFEGLQSSFEEKVNENGKYEIEILSNNKNLVFEPLVNGDIYNENGQMITYNNTIWRTNYIKVKPNTTYIVSYDIAPNWRAIFFYDKNKKFISNFDKSSTFTTPTNCYYIGFKAPFNTGNVKLQIEKGTQITSYTPHKSNKIKLLINEPLKAVYGKKDRLCIKEGKLTIERNTKQINLTKDLSIVTWKRNDNFYSFGIEISDINKLRFDKVCLSDVFPSLTGADIDSYVGEGVGYWDNAVQMCINISSSKLTEYSVSAFKNWLQNNPTKVVYQLEEPIYEEVLNEYGEPIILEGYENGTIYIDSTIVPTTTVRYTPKMESFKTLKEVENSNIMLTNDVNDNIIPYMMDVDLMIMEKETALMSQKNIRTIGVKDMTSMQKRTQYMLTRLIKGKTLTEEECKTRVVIYLNAGKITDAQAEELMLLIDEIYA